MPADWNRLTRGRARFLIRILGLAGFAFAVGGALLMLAPLPEPPDLQQVAQAATRRFVDYSFLFPKFSELSSARPTPFEFQELVRAKVKLREKENKAEVKPPPKPDVAGLTLVGTVPGNRRALAVLFDEQDGRMTNIARGDEVRNSVVKDILADRIVLALNEEEEYLPLIPIRGSENLSRQLQGLSPLPDTQAPDANQTQQVAQVAPPNQPSGNAVLVGVSNTATAGNTVVTQTGSGSRSVRRRPQASGATPGSGASQPGGTQPPPPGATGATPGSGQSQPGDTQAPPRPNRSLGISGHMLSLDQQQEMGLRETGLLVTNVRDSGSPIQVNDVILAISGQPIESLSSARELLQSVQGDTVQLRVSRSGTTTEINAPLN